ncbi:amidohydrolase [Acidobacteria bacterium AB60]|nr:amidohydrolase [Acidobacteria bacterium AB60]
MHRRALLKATAAAMAASAIGASGTSAAAVPVIDAHIHLFDPTRPGGVPWPPASDSVLSRPALPPRYEALSRPHGVVGAIAVECSPWVADNFWLQDVVQRNPGIVGFIGDLAPEAPEFGAALDLLRRGELFLGIRYGNLWNRDLAAAAHNPRFLAGLKLVAQAGLIFETANPDPQLIAAVVAISDAVPDLRIVLDHLPHAERPKNAAARDGFDRNLRELASRPQVFAKGSEILKQSEGRVAVDVKLYRDGLDRLWDLFGEDRMLFGSDWPNSDSLANYDETFGVAQRYISGRGGKAQEKYFWRNSVSAYRWKPRTQEQGQLR